MTQLAIIIEGELCPADPHWHWNGAPWEMHPSAGLICLVRFEYHEPTRGILESVTASVRHAPVEVLA